MNVRYAVFREMAKRTRKLLSQVPEKFYELEVEKLIEITRR